MDITQAQFEALELNDKVWVNAVALGEDATAITDVRASRDFRTEAEAEAFVATFPKALRVRIGYVSSLLGDKHVGWYSANFQVDFASDNINKGKNEAGIKRLLKFLSKCEGSWMFHQPWGNSSTREQFDAFMDSIGKTAR